MSKLIAAAAINGAYKIVEQAEKKWQEALEKFGATAKIEFPNTGYYLPIIYGMLGIRVQKLEEAKVVLDICRRLLPPKVKERVNLPYLGPALDAGMATLFAEEIIEAIKILEKPDIYLASLEEPTDSNLWLGPADDVILRKRGVEFVDGTAPGFAAILGSVPAPEIAAKIAEELQHKNLYIFMSSEYNGKRFSEQLQEANVQLGWNVRLVPFGPDTSATVFSLGFATRAALSFGGVSPGDFRRILIYNKDRIFAFVLAFGDVTEEWYANAAGAINFGFPVIADTPIPEILPTGICTYEHVVSNIPYEETVAKAVEVRGLKVTVTTVPVPVSYGPAFEGERIRGEDIYMECGGGRTIGIEWLSMRDMSEIEDGKIVMHGPELDQVQAGSKLPLAIRVFAAGRNMQEDFEPILERQIHHLLNYAQGVMHIGQRDIAWVRISKQAVAKGFRFSHFGTILHAKLHADFGAIVDKVEVHIYTTDEDAKKILEDAKKVFRHRDERIEGMVDEQTETYFSCTLCQSFAPTHVCVVTPERPGLCGAYSWLDCKASNEINPTGPNQPINKGEVIDLTLGQWKGVNEFVRKASRGAVEKYNAYSIMKDPMTSCGCFECIAAVLPICNGVMIVDRDCREMTPCGMKFSTLAGFVGGGSITPGFVGHSKYYISSRKYIRADGSIKRIAWMPKRLKGEVRERFEKRAVEIGIPDLLDRIADETVGLTEETILPFLKEKKHPALEMPPIME